MPVLVVLAPPERVLNPNTKVTSAVVLHNLASFSRISV